MTWYAAHRQLQSASTIVGRHHPDWLKLPVEATEPIVQFWLEWHRQHGSMPPGLVTVEGLLVDGNHRFEACRRLGVSLWCCLVRSDGGWVATGGVTKVSARSAREG